MYKKVFCTLLFITLFLCGCTTKDNAPGTLNAVLKRKKLIVGVRTDYSASSFENTTMNNWRLGVEAGYRF